MKKDSEKPSKHLMKINVPLMSRGECLHEFNKTGTNISEDESIFWKKFMCGGRLDPTLGKSIEYKKNSHCREGSS